MIRPEISGPDSRFGSPHRLSAFAFGYAGELLARFPELAARYSAWLDHLESDAPTLAHYLALAAPESAKPLERSIRLISAQRLDVHLLEHFLPGIFLSRMTSAELCTVLDLLVSAGDPSSLHIATDFIGHCIQFERPFQRDERAAMWRVLDASAPIEDRAHYWWTAAVEQFSNENPEQAIRTAIRGLLGSDYDKRNSAWDVLSKVARSTWASTNANVLLEGIGELLLDKENSWRLSTGPERALPDNSRVRCSRLASSTRCRGRTSTCDVPTGTSFRCRR